MNQKIVGSVVVLAGILFLFQNCGIKVPSVNDQFLADYDLLSATIPSPASNLEMQVLSSSEITLRWNASMSPGIQYRIEFSSDSAFSSINTKLVPGDQTQASISGLSPNVSYFFRVAAFNTAGDSIWSNTVSGTPVQSANFTLSTTAITTTSITLGWNSTQAAATSYEAQIAIQSDFSDATTVNAGTNTSSAFTDLIPNQQYYFRVRAVGPIQSWPWSGAISATTLPLNFCGAMTLSQNLVIPSSSIQDLVATKNSSVGPSADAWPLVFQVSGTATSGTHYSSNPAVANSTISGSIGPNTPATLPIQFTNIRTTTQGTAAASIQVSLVKVNNQTCTSPIIRTVTLSPAPTPSPTPTPTPYCSLVTLNSPTSIALGSSGTFTATKASSVGTTSSPWQLQFTISGATYSTHYTSNPVASSNLISGISLPTGTSSATSFSITNSRNLAGGTGAVNLVAKLTSVNGDPCPTGPTRTITLVAPTPTPTPVPVCSLVTLSTSSNSLAAGVAANITTAKTASAPNGTYNFTIKFTGGTYTIHFTTSPVATSNVVSGSITTGLLSGVGATFVTGLKNNRRVGTGGIGTIPITAVIDSVNGTPCTNGSSVQVNLLEAGI